MLGMHNTCDQVIVLLLLGTLFVHRESEGIVTGCLFLPQQCANMEVELDSMIAHVSLEHVTQFVSLAIMQGSQDD